MFSRWFGSPKNQNTGTTTADAIAQLDNIEETYLKKQDHLESQINDEKQKALKLSKQGNKRAALIAMKKAKKFEKDLGQVDGILQTIDNQKDALRNAQSSKATFSAMQLAATEIKKAHAGMSVEDVEQLKDDMEDQRQFGNIHLRLSIRF